LSIPKAAVLVTGLAAAVLVATISPMPAQATPRARACTDCHGAGGSTTAVPSATTMAPGAAYNVVINLTNTSAGNTGWWIDGIGGTFGGNSSAAMTYTVAMTAPATAGVYPYTVWTVKGYSGLANSTAYSITVGSTTPPTTVPPTTVPPTPPVSSAHITKLSPDEGYVGTTVTIKGTGFGKAGVVKFGKVVAKVSSWTATKIVVKVPAGHYDRKVLVTVTPKGAKASNGVEFNVKSHHPPDAADRVRPSRRHSKGSGMWKLVVFAVSSALIAAASWRSLWRPAAHGLPRFLAWEVIGALILFNVEHWFTDPWSPLQLLSWVLLVGFILSVAASTFLVVTAHVEERENMVRFGEAYSAYRRSTRRFIPFIY
jgi:IPT/TIG domain